MKLDFKFVFFGTPEFAAIILEKLIEADFLPQAVVCNPDKPVGRKKIITPPPVKQSILNLESGIRNKIKIFQPEKLSDIKSQLSDVNCQLFIVAAYNKIIPKEFLEIPRFGSIGVHPSLLPKHRGPSPIQTALLNGDEKTGVTLFLMDEKVDHGPILVAQELEFSIYPPAPTLPTSPRLRGTSRRAGNFQFSVLQHELAELGADLLIETLPDIENKIKNARPQDETLATFTKKFKTEDAFVRFADLKKSMEESGETAAIIERKIRAFNPEPGVFAFFEKNGRPLRIKILDAVLKEGKLVLTKIQPEGKTVINDLNAIKQYVD